LHPCRSFHYEREMERGINNRSILILGGYGGVGRFLARLLLRETQVDLIIAGRRKEKADAFAAVLQREFLHSRVSSLYADASNQESLINAFGGVRLVIVLTTTPDFIKQIGQAALLSGCDYLDILVSESAFHDLKELASPIRQQGRIFITQAGFHPGLPAVFVRYGAQYFDRYDKATVAMAMNARFERAEQAAEIIPLLSEFRAEIYKDGAWRKATYRDVVNVDMGNRFGTMKLFPIAMEEMKQAQEMFNLAETGVFVSGFNWFVDYLVMPVIFLTQKIRKGFATDLLLKLFTWGVNRFSSPDQGVVFLNEAEGMKDGKKIKVRIIAEHDEAYLFTAIPVVACLKQYLNGALPAGLWMMGHVVDEKKLFDDMEKMGVRIRTEIENDHPTTSCSHALQS
jgi:saccharopine dehydrogenase-like NADP-dependent oxidoreductase